MELDSHSIPINFCWLLSMPFEIFLIIVLNLFSNHPTKEEYRSFLSLLRTCYPIKEIILDTIKNHNLSIPNWLNGAKSRGIWILSVNKALCLHCDTFIENEREFIAHCYHKATPDIYPFKITPTIEGKTICHMCWKLYLREIDLSKTKIYTCKNVYTCGLWLMCKECYESHKCQPKVYEHYVKHLLYNKLPWYNYDHRFGSKKCNYCLLPCEPCSLKVFYDKSIERACPRCFTKLAVIEQQGNKYLSRCKTCQKTIESNKNLRFQVEPIAIYCQKCFIHPQ